MTTQTLASPASSVRSGATDLLGIALAFGLGAALVFVAGFSHASAMHDVAHDQRHAIAFPCH